MNNTLQQGIDALKAGDRTNARRLLFDATKQDPDSERAWGWLYNASDTDAERLNCLKQMTRINPGNEKANTLLKKLAETLIEDYPLEEVSSQAPAQATKKCPYCAETVLAEAAVCKYCGRNIHPSMVQAERLQLQSKSIMQMVWSIFWLAILIGCLVLMSPFLIGIFTGK
jgi:hypothetical protein